MIEKMERFQVYLEAGMSKELAKIAAQQGVSKAELIRAGVKRILQEKAEVKGDPILGIVGMGHGGPGRVSVKHDNFLVGIRLRKMRR